MKKIINTGIAVLLFCVFYSCSESWLETVSNDTYNEANWWQTESQAISSINGCYAVLRNSHIGGTSNMSEDNITPNSYNMSGEIAIATGNHTPGNDTRFRDKWNVCYQGIGRANNLLDNIDKVVMTDALKQRIKAEAYFLRAFFYSKLINYYGGVPLILSAPNFAEQSDLPRNSKEEVLTQVLADLDNAASVLPVSYSGADKGRATKGAALALKTRVLLYESKWAEAAAAAKSVMELNQYILFSDYRALFYLENEFNKEIIFDIQFKTPEYTNGFDNILEVQMNCAPTLDLANSYLMKDGKIMQESPLYDPDHPWENRDPRFHKTIVVPGYMYLGRIVPESKYFSTGFGFKKYTTYKDDVAQSVILNSEINFIVLRYADVLLMYAEAQNEAVGPDESVYAALKQIRTRAGMPEIEAGLSKDQMRQVIRHERRIELANEGLYYTDIRRWKTAEIVMNATVLSRTGQLVQTRTFNPNRDYLWPIHEITIQDNPKLQQNPNY
ncbi:MAG TPA: RagB/SusD family nutrient uptake outer membrane protein [Bacteroidales bacterium]|nr:RagB/SusD family nutrient uptake outer membrane protein [Bacteroidales bacterium]